MKLKIDTKATYSVITPEISELNAKLAEDIADACQKLWDSEPTNCLIDLSNCQSAEAGAMDVFSSLHEEAYGQNCSLVFTGFGTNVLATMRNTGANEMLNLAPSLPEAIDIISMEILERDLLEGDEN